MTRIALVLAALITMLLAGTASAGCFLPHEVEDTRAAAEEEVL